MTRIADRGLRIALEAVCPPSAIRYPQSHRRSIGPRGFTLLEVLISMAILVMAIAAILPLFAVGTASHKRGMDQTIVSLIAPQISAKIQEGLWSDRPANIQTAPITVQGQMFFYDAAFTPLDRNDPAHSAFVVRVTIKWNEGGRLRTEEFATVLLRRLRR